MLLAINRKALPIADMPNFLRFLSQSFRRALSSSPKRFGDSLTGLASLFAGKGKGKAPASPEAISESDGIYAAHLTTSESEGENQEYQVSTSEPEEDESLVAQRAELRSKKLNDPSRIRTPQATLPPAPAQAVV
uniref:Uncharacterized protein n=1 Tax=Solanum tuberosum TaxID=4113 RepID=M1DI48_SOLTU